MTANKIQHLPYQVDGVVKSESGEIIGLRVKEEGIKTTEWVVNKILAGYDFFIQGEGETTAILVKDGANGTKHLTTIADETQANNINKLERLPECDVKQ